MKRPFFFDRMTARRLSDAHGKVSLGLDELIQGTKRSRGHGLSFLRRSVINSQCAGNKEIAVLVQGLANDQSSSEITVGLTSIDLVRFLLRFYDFVISIY